MIDYCSICQKKVRENAKAVLCDICEKWVHIGCNYVSKQSYEFFEKSDDSETFYCSSCLNVVIPFGNESDQTFSQTNVIGLNNESDLENLSVFINKNEQKLINQISNLILENADPDSQNANFCSYYNIDNFCNKKFDSQKYFFLFHLNIESLQAHKNDLDILLHELNFDFDIIAISETRLIKDIAPTHDIELKEYNIEHTPTEASKGGTLLYISDKYEYKLRKDLEIYISKEIESTFIEILKPKSQNIIVGCIYRHHTISQKDFNDIMESLLTKISKENKICYLVGDFNMDLLQLHKHTVIEHFFDTLTSNKFMPLITNPTRISKTSKTLIDNIFHNQFSSATTSGNLTVGISDHLPQFSLIPYSNSFPAKPNATKKIRKYKQVDIAKLNQDLNSIDWTMQDNDDINQYGSNFLNVFQQIIETHAPLTEIKLTKANIKQKLKPWINDEIIKMIKIKDKLHSQYTKEHDPVKKLQLQINYKVKKNEITKMIRCSKRSYYNEYFAKNNNNIKKLWVGINQIVNNVKNKDQGPTCIEIDNNGTTVNITKPTEIAEEIADLISIILMLLTKC